MSKCIIIIHIWQRGSKLLNITTFGRGLRHLNITMFGRGGGGVEAFKFYKITFGRGFEAFKQKYGLSGDNGI